MYHVSEITKQHHVLCRTVANARPWVLLILWTGQKILIVYSLVGHFSPCFYQRWFHCVINVITLLNPSLKGFVTVFGGYGGLLCSFRCMTVQRMPLGIFSHGGCPPHCNHPFLHRSGDVWHHFLLSLTWVSLRILCFYNFSWIFWWVPKDF